MSYGSRSLPWPTQRPQSSSVLGLPYRILNINPQQELLWGLWVGTRPLATTRASGTQHENFQKINPMGSHHHRTPSHMLMSGNVERCMHPIRDPKKHISISILSGYPYPIGLHYKGVYMGYPYPNFCLCAFWRALPIGIISGFYPEPPKA